MSKKAAPTRIHSRLQTDEMYTVFSKALKDITIISPDDTAAVFLDLAFIEERSKGLLSLFPPGTLHAVAVKANPLIRVLEKMRFLGSGAEVASLPELFMAEKAGFAPETIVFDSPCKTREEIGYALHAGVYINADSFDELDRIAEMLKNINSSSGIGLRINPQVGTGTIKATSVAGDISKFGVPLNENRDKIKEYYLKYEWLKGMHVHIGSQGCPVSLLVNGIRKVLDLALETNKQLKTGSKPKQIEVFDIGGGLPVSYYENQEPVSMAEYVSILNDSCNELFTGKFRLITEFGRYIFANSGWVVSRVEYVKQEKNHNIIITHVGADLFLRKAYNPNDWHHHISVVDKNGKMKTGTDENRYTVAGPLCFAGDVLATDLELPEVNEGDYLLIHDAGAYTLSMWSRYNSRQMPKVVGYSEKENRFEILKQRESIEKTEDYWA